MSVEKDHGGFHLLDVSALVVGYGMASLLVRAYWPDSGTPGVWETLMIGLVFAWLGAAMSGPIVMLIRRPAPRAPDEDGPEEASRTWAELAWMIIGFYWIGLTILVVPVRMRGTMVLDSAILGIFPVLAAIGLRFSAIRVRRFVAGPETAAAWTHRAGVWLLLTWPFAWLGLILLGKTLL
jgi:hypothetical protein